MGPLEILIVGVLALLVFGPERLPEIGRSLGKGLSQFKKMASDVKSEFDFGLEEEKAAAKPTGEAQADPVVDSDPRPAEMTNGSLPSV
ncbi:MAG TPA: twin-arginine translocase TatA/TatE family subunit [Fimbriimonadaceae bacterium]|nr:twin-arginine translocase TatA/TatE family subunit [Fimbriimonadaceae bacterium]